MIAISSPRRAEDAGLSLPVKLLSRVTPRGLAIVLGFAVLAGLLPLLLAGMSRACSTTLVGLGCG
jgi:hypothetical protein